MEQKPEKNIVSSAGDNADGVTEIDQMKQDLYVRQIELEMQSEELRQARDELLENQIELKKQNEELSRALEAEYQSGERFRLLFMNAPIPYQSLDEIGNFIDVNQAFQNVLGYSKEELLGQNFGDFLHPDWANHFKENFPRFKAIGEVLGVEFVMVKKDGSSILVSFTGKVQCDNQGNFQRTHCVFQDITHRKRTEDALLESETRCRALVDLGVDGILLGSEEGIITYADKRICKIFGMEEEDFIGKNIRTLPHTHECHRKSPFRFDVLQEGEIVKSERMLIRPDGSEVTLETRTKMMPDGTYQLVCHDITSRVQLEKALVEAERLSAFGELSAGVAHDYNNSLQMIIGYLDLAILNPNTNPDVAELIKNARRSALDAATRVRQLQRFTKKTSRAKFRAMNINNLLEEAVQQSRPLWKDEAEKRGLQFSFQKYYGKIEAVEGDDGEIRSALHNLIKNAVEAMPSGGMITLETGVFDKNVYVRIADTGTGMDEETRRRIFEPFFTTKGYKLGMGLGMSIVYSTIRDHGGKISIKATEVGKGTMIEILFPFMKKGEEVLEEQPLAVSQISVRVLWVDDEEVIRKMGKLFLEQQGHSVDLAASGEEAIKLLAMNKYDLMITDIGMPKMSGWQFLKAINGQYSEMKVVVLSGWGAADFDDEKAMYGIEHVVGKPITQSELKRLFDQMFQVKA